jgi:trk/ktr system potassium uptake protein
MQQDLRIKIKRYADIAIASLAALSLGLIVSLLGFYFKLEEIHIIRIFTLTGAYIYVAQEILRWLLPRPSWKVIAKNKFENINSLAILLLLLFEKSFILYLFHKLDFLEFIEANIVIYSIINLLVLLGAAYKGIKKRDLIAKINMHPGAIFALSFAIIILIGTMLLMLPRSHAMQPLGFIDAIFTSTSAVCVTGLTTVNTAHEFTLFGKFVVLILIQIGGLGIMTLSTFFAAFFTSGLSYRTNIMMKDLLSQESISEVSKLLIRIMMFTFLIELVGALLIYKSLGGELLSPHWNMLGASIFHSISAFCNAGFSVYPNGLADPAIASNVSFLSIIMALVVLGGLGFAVLANLTTIFHFGRSKRKLRYRFSVSSKLVLATTGALLLLGAAMIMMTESHAMPKGMSFLEKAWHSLFLSVTARTAGFNTYDVGMVSVPGMMLMIMLMWVGASPGSTGGGIKTTTFVVSFVALYNTIRGKKKIEMFGREIDQSVLNKSAMVIFASLFFIFVGCFLLILLEPKQEPMDLIFEVVSAISTVGLSRGVTPDLSAMGKAVVILLMFVGRIGVLTFFMSFAKPKEETRYSLPRESVSIG